MKASELIEILAARIGMYGDLPVYVPEEATFTLRTITGLQQDSMVVPHHIMLVLGDPLGSEEAEGNNG